MPSSDAADSRPLRIFIVEDNADTLKWLTMYLEGCGHQVVAEQTLHGALKALPTSACDILISDTGLPMVMDGACSLNFARKGGLVPSIPSQ